MFVSLNEIDVSVKRAVRGIGMGWGIAEEAGKAARFLASRGLPALEMLLPLLHAQDGVKPARLVPRVLGKEWQAPGGGVCPIIAGAALADDAGDIVRTQMITLRAVQSPLLLVPFVTRAARTSGKAAQVSWPGVSAHCGTDGVVISGDAAKADPADVVISFGGSAPAAPPPLRERQEPVSVSDALWKDLQVFAARTYVPASDHSRLMGAGAGLTDND